MAQEILTINDIAQQLDLSVKSVRKLVASGQLPATKSNSRYLIAMKDFEEYCRKVEHRGETACDKRQTAKLSERVNWCDISPFWENPPQSHMTFVDLFCGAEDFQRGLKWQDLREFAASTGSTRHV